MPENDTPRAARYPLLTPSQAAERLGVSTRTMQRMLAEGRMPAVQISSKTYRIRPDVIDELLARAALNTGDGRVMDAGAHPQLGLRPAPSLAKCL